VAVVGILSIFYKIPISLWKKDVEQRIILKWLENLALDKDQ
jgi:hypothetical protein